MFPTGGILTQRHPPNHIGILSTYPHISLLPAHNFYIENF